MNAIRYVAVGIVLGVIFDAGAKTTKWKGEDGRWNDPAMWDNGVPGPEDGAELPYAASRAPDGYVITVEGDQVVGGLHFTDAGAEANGDGPVTFVGDGRLLISHKTFFRPVIVDGPIIDFSGDSTEMPVVRQDITIKSGAFVYTNAAQTAQMFFNCDALSSRPMQTYLTGGLLMIDIYSCYDIPKSILHQAGGTFVASRFVDTSYADSYRTYPQLDLKGGTFQLGSLIHFGGTTTYDFGEATIKNDIVSFDGGAALGDTWLYDLPRFLIGSQLYISSYNPTVHFSHGVEFASYGDWSLNQKMSFDGRENIVFDTLDAHDGETKHTVTGWQYGFRMKRRNAITIKGGGKFDIDNSESLFSNSAGSSGADLDIFDSFAILDGTYFRLHSVDIYRANRIYAEEFVMGDDATFEFKTYNTFIVATRATIGTGAKLVVEVPDNCAENEYAVLHATFVPTLVNLAVELTGDGAVNYDVHRTDHTIFLRRKDYTPVVAGSNNPWVGKGADANVSTGANWKDGADKDSLWIFQIGIGATEGLVMNNDLGSQLIYRFELDGGAGPFRVTGDPLNFMSQAIDGSYAAINNYSRFPLTFENQVCQSSDYTALAVQSGYVPSNCGSVTELLGGMDVANLFYVQGLVKVGGKATVGRIQLAKELGFAAVLEVLDGANVSVTNQLLEGDNVASCSPSFLRVDQGGVLRFTGGTGYLDNYAHTHDVNGTLAFDIPLVSAAEMQAFAGCGRLEISDVLPGGDNDVAVHVAEKLKVYPKGWNTAVAAHPAKKVTLVVDTHATLGALQDWTYGPMEDANPTTTAADRALVVANHETLTIDTENPDTGAAQTITFADPLAAGGDVIKRGAGTLAFACTGNVVAGTFRVTDGTLALAGALADATGWMEVLTADRIELDVSFADSEWRVRQIIDSDGKARLCLKKRAGLAVIVK